MGDGYASLLFLVESGIMHYVFHEEVYSVVFLFLGCTSIAYRTWPSHCTRWINKLAIMYVVVYGGWVLTERVGTQVMDQLSLVTGIALSFLSVLYLYYGGYFMKKYCFHPDEDQSSYWYGWMYGMGCVGHILIAMLPDTAYELEFDAGAPFT